MIYKQKECKVLGEEGCYFLSLLWVAERELGKDLDALAVFAEAKRNGWVGADCFVKDGAALVGHLLGRKCALRKSWSFAEKLAENERDIWCWRRDATGITYWHFVAMDSAGRVAYDPLEDSNTVRLGRPESRRILTIG